MDERDDLDDGDDHDCESPQPAEETGKDPLDQRKSNKSNLGASAARELISWHLVKAVIRSHYLYIQMWYDSAATKFHE